MIARYCFRETCTPLGRVASAGILPVKFTRLSHRLDGELEAYAAIVNSFQNHTFRFLSPQYDSRIGLLERGRDSKNSETFNEDRSQNTVAHTGSCSALDASVRNKQGQRDEGEDGSSCESFIHHAFAFVDGIKAGSFRAF